MNAEQIMAACSNLLLTAAAQNHVALLKSFLELQNMPVDTFFDYVPSSSFQSPSKRRTLAMIAAHHGSIDTLAYLLGRGADPNIQSPTDGYTALHCTAEGNSSKTAEIIAHLLSVGAARDVTDSFGRKPIDLLLGSKQAQQFDDSGSSSGYSTPSISELDKNEYQSDEFRMFGFKVMKCTRVKAHDWTECPFAHPGEKARRRDPKKFAYSGTACPDFRKGTCKRGDACPFAHGVFECWLHPARYRTQLCKDAPTCTRRVCFFAHSLEELRQPQAADGTLLPLEALSDDLDCGSLDNSPRLGSESGYDVPELSSNASSDLGAASQAGPTGAGGPPLSGRSSIRQLSPHPVGSPPADGSLPNGHSALFNLHSANALSSLSSALQGLVITGNFGTAGLQDIFPQRSAELGHGYARISSQQQPVAFQPAASTPADISLVPQQSNGYTSLKDAQRPVVHDNKVINAALGSKHTSSVPHNLSYSSLDVSWVSVLTDDDSKSSLLPFSAHTANTPMWSHPEIISS